MANEQQYINPIIQAMMQSQQLAQQKAQQQEQAKQFVQEQKVRQQLADQAQTRLEQEHEFQQKTLQNAHDALQGHLAQTQNEALMNVVRNIGAGGSAAMYKDPGTSQPIPGSIPGGPQLPTIPQGTGGTPAGMVNIPGVGLRPESSLPTQSGILQMMEAEARAKSAGAASGALPSKLTELEADTKARQTIQNDENAFKANQSGLERISKERIAKMERDTQMMIANAHNSTAVQVAGMTRGVTPDDITSGVVAAMTGQRKFTSDNIFDRRVMQGVQDAGGRTLDPKDADTLKSLNGLNDVFDKIGGFIDKNLPSEAKEGSFIAKTKAFGQGLVAKSPLPTDVKNQYNAIKTSAIQIGRGLEGLTGGRVLSKQLELDLDGLTSPGVTAEQGRLLLNNLKDKYVNQMQNSTLSGMPDAQKKLIYKTYGIKPPWLVTAPRTNTAGHTLDEDKSIELGQPVYK